MKVCLEVRAQTKDLTWELGMKSLTLKNYSPFTQVVERDSIRHWKQRRGVEIPRFIIWVNNFIIDQKKCIDRVECLMRRNGATA